MLLTWTCGAWLLTLELWLAELQKREKWMSVLGPLQVNTTFVNELQEQALKIQSFTMCF